MKVNLLAQERYLFINFALENDIDLFPIKTGQKAPPPKGWQKMACCDRLKFQNWFLENDHNIGVATGNGLVVVDVDMKSKKDGLASLHELENEVGQTLPPTFTVRTPNHGLHFYYFYDANQHEIGNSINEIGDGIDIRGDGGYVVGPGSKIVKGVYTREL